MHPAGSLIYFTVASGFGFGFLFFLGLGIPDVKGQAAFWHYVIAYGLAVTGLMSSVLHLGNPINAWKAFSQWRSSWLSREGVVAVATLLAFAPLAVTQIWGGPDLSWLGYIAAVLSLMTVYCTSMIYGSLKTVPRWNHFMTPVLFLSYAIAGGALLAQSHEIADAACSLVVVIQITNFLWGERRWNRSASSAKTATGLGGADGTVRLLERPHTGKNYLTREMVHKIGRKHANRLTGISIILLCITSLADNFLGGHLLPILLLPLALAAMVSRWLFFAQAEHVVGLFYGRLK